MRITLITFVTPYHFNKGAASALPYHLLQRREEDIDVKIYTYNHNRLSTEEIQDVEKELNVEIKLLHYPKWIKWLFVFHLSFLKVFLRLPLFAYFKLTRQEVEKVRADHPDALWIYSADLVKVEKQFPEIPCLMTLPDSVSLYYYRRLNVAFSLNDWKTHVKDFLMYRKYIHLEQDYTVSDNRWYHLVGEEDANELCRINPGISAHFVHHPTYNILEPAKSVSFSVPKIKLLLAGQYNYYMQQTGDELIDALSTDHELQHLYDITFLGKGWEHSVKALENAGYDVHHIHFAPNYIEEIVKYDIQITPIAIGTGTKGKVLDALANGLLVIGTPYAMENIAVKDKESCLIYKDAQTALDLLKKVAQDRAKYEVMAEKGRESVISQHERSYCAKRMFDLIEKKKEV